MRFIETAPLQRSDWSDVDLELDVKLTAASNCVNRQFETNREDF